jgi:hypothetical protein
LSTPKLNFLSAVRGPGFAINTKDFHNILAYQLC